MKPAPHGRHAIPRGSDGGLNGDARSGSDREANYLGSSELMTRHSIVGVGTLGA
jgi:hypothetical protein